MRRDGTHSRNWSLYLSAALFSSAIVLICIFGGWSIYHGKQVNDELCRLADQNRTAIVNILLEVEERALERATSERQITQIEQNTSELLALVPPIDCDNGGRPVELIP